MSIEVSVNYAPWKELDLSVVAERAIGAGLRYCKLDLEICEVSVLGCSDAEISVLNQTFRDKARATNVLSWPERDLSPEREGEAPQAPKTDFSGDMVLGDIAIAFETCAREATAAGKPLSDHVTHLLVHGLLHLLGYDHVCDGDAARMEALEAKILGTLGLDDPYREVTGR